jgi:hypothetical protein
MIVGVNLWLEAGVCNGSIGHIVDIIYHEGEKSPQNQPACILV